MYYYTTVSHFVITNPDKVLTKLTGLTKLKNKWHGIDYAKLEKARLIEEAFAACGFTYSWANDALDVSGCDELITIRNVLKRVAPFVANDSYVEIAGSQSVWRYYFWDGELHAVFPTWANEHHPLLPPNTASHYQWWTSPSYGLARVGVHELETRNMLASFMVWLYERLAAYKIDAPDTVRLDALEILYGGRTYLEDEMIEEVMERVGEWLRGEQTDAQADEILRMFTALVPHLWH